MKVLLERILFKQFMKTYWLITTLTLLSLSIAVPAQDKHTADSLRRAINNATTDTGRFGTRVRMALYYLDTYNSIAGGRLDTAERYLRQAKELHNKHDAPQLQNLMSISYALLYCWRNPDEDPKKSFLPAIAACSKTGDKENESYAWELLAYFIEENPVKNPYRLMCYEKAMALSHQLGLVDEEKYALVEIAGIHSDQKRYSVAETELFQVIKEAKREGLRNVMAAYDLLAGIYITKAVYDKALYYEIKYQKSAESTGDTPTAAAAYARVANIYSYMRNYSLAID
jgi:hypothetical protein